MAPLDLGFRPTRMLFGGNLQTFAAFYFYARKLPEQAVHQHVTLPDGDIIVLHDDCPAGWQRGDRTALLVHGVCGYHGSSYVSRTARRLNEHGVRTFRIDLRGQGAGEALARHPYHGGSSPDLAAAVQAAKELTDGSPLSVIGFSLGGNILLKMLGEAPEWGMPVIEQAIAVNPPIDITQTSRALSRGFGRLYDKYFCDILWNQLQARQKLRPDLVTVTFPRRPRTVREFDEVFTAPLGGFASAKDYYEKVSSAQLLHKIQVPTIILTAADDPLIPVEPFLKAERSPHVALHVSQKGGHLGYISRGSKDPDRHWMDWRVVEWVTSMPTHNGTEVSVTPRTRPIKG